MINTIFVDVTVGSDQLGDGSQLKPFFSIQAALELAKSTKMPVVVQVAPGNYAGFDLQNFSVPLPTDVISGAFLSIVGTPVLYVPAVGLSMGPVASAVNGVTDVSTITVTAAGWTPGELNNKFVRIPNPAGDNTVMIPISGNTTDTLQLVPSAFTSNQIPVAGSIFTIMDMGTVINTQPPRYPLSMTNKLVKRASAGVLISNSQGPNNSISIQCLKFTFGSETTAIRIERSSVSLRNCCILSSGRGPLDKFVGISLTNATQAYIIHCIIDCGGVGVNRFSTAGISTGRQSDLGNALSLSGSVISGASISLSLNGNVVASGVLFRNASHAGVGQHYSVSNSQFIRCVFDNCNNGFYLQESYSSGPCSNAFGLNQVTIKNCASAGMTLAGPMSGVYMRNVLGAGNGVGIRLTHGAFAGVTSDVTLSGTVEVQIDGITTTLVAMRAATPKIVRDLNFGSRLYEISN